MSLLSAPRSKARRLVLLHCGLTVGQSLHVSEPFSNEEPVARAFWPCKRYVLRQLRHAARLLAVTPCHVVTTVSVLRHTGLLSNAYARPTRQAHLCHVSAGF